MKVAVFSAKPYDREFLTKVNQKYGHELKFFGAVLDSSTAKLAKGFEAVCVFVNDRLERQTIEILSDVCRILADDLNPDREFAEQFGEYTRLEDLLSQSDIISLHCPLTDDTHHLIDTAAVNLMKPGVMLINTSRGGLIDTKAVIKGLKAKQIGHLGLDVYEQEGKLFFEDLSGEIIQDDDFERLLTFPNVIITGHQAFFTADALNNIAETTLSNITAIAQRSQREIASNQPCSDLSQLHAGERNSP